MGSCTTRALLDNVATLVISDLFKKLGLKTKRVAGKITGFCRSTILTSKTIQATIGANKGYSKYFESLRFTVIDQITNKMQ